MVLSLPDMAAEEKQQLALLQKQNKALEKQLEDARMKNIALDLLIEVAEEKLKISIRKSLVPNSSIACADVWKLQ